MDPYRLPRSVIPSRYDLRLEPDLERAAFAGEVTVTVAVREAVSVVRLNAAELHLDSATLTPDGGSPLPAAVALEDDTERAALTFAAPLPLGGAKLHIRFRGTLNDKLRGFYRSRYKGE